MFKLHRHKSDKSGGDKIDFKFSHFQLLQVPKEWDKLFVSIISVETGKAVAKSTKSLVRNGKCVWKESLSESIWISPEVAPKEMEENLIKLAVSTGSVRSTILGEVIINLSTYISSKSPVSVSFPLKKNNSGTVLQVKIHCLNPRATVRDEQRQEITTPDYDETDSRSDISDNSYARSVGSSSSNHLGSNSHPAEVGSRNTSFSASGSRHSSDSVEGFVDKTTSSPRHNFSGDLYSPMARQDSSSSQSSANHVVGPADDLSPSNYSSFNSRFSASGGNLHSQRQDLGKNSSNSLAVSSLRNGSSSKGLLEEAEDTIEELRSEAKTWERNARKLMLDVDMLRKESTENTRHRADLDMELSAASTERDGLRQEIEQLKRLLEESKSKHMASDHSISQAEGITHIQKELEREIKFQKESNTNLAVQLERSQESNIELVSILQELEETIETQRQEIDNLLAEKTEPVISESSEEPHYELLAKLQLLEKAVEEKNKDLDFERNLRNKTVLELEVDYKSKLSVKEKELITLEEKLSNLRSTHGSDDSKVADDSDLLNEIEALKEKVQELESDCNELTEENLELIFKMNQSKKDLQPGGDSFNYSSSELQSTISVTGSEPEVDSVRSQNQVKLKNMEPLSEEVSSTKLEVQLIDLQDRISDLELQLHSSEDKASHLEAQLRNSRFEMEERGMEIDALKEQLRSYHEESTHREFQPESHSSEEFFSELCSQLQASFTHLQRPWYNALSHVKTESEISHCDLVVSDNANGVSEKWQAEAILNKVIELNKRLEAKILESETAFQHLEAKQETNLSATESQELENLKKEVADLGKSLLEKGTKAEDLESSLALKQEEIEVLRLSQKQLESEISDLQTEKAQLMMLTSKLDSHVSANKMLERKSSELESGRRELELHLVELEEENIQLSERLSGMEAQLRYLTDEKESSRLDLENSKSLSMDLRSEVKRLETEMENQKTDLKLKLQDMQKRWSEAQEECEYLKRANPKLQATAEDLIEECDLMQKMNGELRKQKLELHDRCTHLDAKLKESRNNFLDCCKKIESLESELSLMQDDITSKEKLLTSELDSLLHENKELQEKFVLEESLLSQMYMEKTVEVESLQREVAHLTEQISSTHDEREQIASSAVRDVSTLRADKAKMESSLLETQAKVKLLETKLQTVQLESEAKVQGLKSELASYKQNQDLVVAEQEKLQRLVDEVKSNEERSKGTVSKLELQLTTSEYEKQQLVEEIASLKLQLQKIGQLQDEIVGLKNSLNEVKFEKDKFEASLQLVTGDCEELKAEKFTYIEKISSMQRSVSELDDSKRSKVALEEKLLRLEGDLTAKEALCAQDAELKNELNRMKRSNSQFQRKLQSLEDEKDEWLKRAQELENELKLKKETQDDLPRDESNHSENGIETNSGNENRRLSIKTQDNGHFVKENGKQQNQNSSNGVDFTVKIQLLENELAEALEANNMYKSQLKKLLSDGQNVNGNSPKKSSSAVESELKDIRERYFHMSLRFAEVEAEREELVMQIKNLKGGRRWFS
ncbi:hypothetical protein ACHQM5_020372 [Ranunculus cassubicifolius]